MTITQLKDGSFAFSISQDEKRNLRDALNADLGEKQVCSTCCGKGRTSDGLGGSDPCEARCWLPPSTRWTMQTNYGSKI